MQYMPIQKKPPQISETVHLQAFITTYRSSSSVFMTIKTPRAAKNRRESHHNRYSQNGQILLLLSSSDGLALRRLNLSRWFMDETAAFYTEQCTSLSLATTQARIRAPSSTDFQAIQVGNRDGSVCFAGMDARQLRSQSRACSRHFLIAMPKENQHLVQVCSRYVRGSKRHRNHS